MQSFWKPIRKTKTSFGMPNLNSYPKRTMKEWKLIDKKPYADSDRDKVMNWFDCRPSVKALQDKIRIVKEPLKSGAIGEYKYVTHSMRGYRKVPSGYKTVLEEIKRNKQEVKKYSRLRKIVNKISPNKLKKIVQLYHDNKGISPEVFSKDEVKGKEISEAFGEAYPEGLEIGGVNSGFYAGYDYVSKHGGYNVNRLKRKMINKFESKMLPAEAELRSLSHQRKTFEKRYNLEELKGREKEPVPSYIIVDEDKFKHQFKKGEKLPKSEKLLKSTLVHEAMHHAFSKLPYKRKLRSSSGIDDIKKSVEKHGKLHEEAMNTAALKVKGMKDYLSGNIENTQFAVESSYHPIHHYEEYAVRLVQHHPEVLKEMKSRQAKQIKRIRKGIRIYGPTIYTKEEYSKHPEKPETLKALNKKIQRIPLPAGIITSRLQPVYSFSHADNIVKETTIPPEKFLRETYKESQRRKPSSQTFEEYKKQVLFRPNVKGIKRVLRGTKSSKYRLPIPFLEYDEKGEPIGHEGRHTMKALHELGVKKAPVTITRRKTMEEEVAERVARREAYQKEEAQKEAEMKEEKYQEVIKQQEKSEAREAKELKASEAKLKRDIKVIEAKEKMEAKEAKEKWSGLSATQKMEVGKRIAKESELPEYMHERFAKEIVSSYDKESK